MILKRLALLHFHLLLLAGGTSARLHEPSRLKLKAGEGASDNFALRNDIFRIRSEEAGEQGRPLKVGDEREVRIASSGDSAIEPIISSDGKQATYKLKVTKDASYVALRFRQFNLAKGCTMTVSGKNIKNKKQEYEMTGKGKREMGTFWAQHVKGDEITLKLKCKGEAKKGGYFVIDKYAEGYGPGHEVGTHRRRTAQCGVDDKENAICYVQGDYTTEYDRSRAVARLLIDGSSACTGWLVGLDGHLITNEHCIGTASSASNTDYEFMAEGPTCDSDCDGWMACSSGDPEDIYSGADFIQVNAGLDYCLVQIGTPDNPALKYGYLEIDNRDAVLDEQIYIPQHPGAYGKKLVIIDSQAASGFCNVDSVTEPGCSSSSYNDTGYMCDTAGGSSGSPVLARSSHEVIALHHCANCPNRGVPINLICDEVGDICRPTFNIDCDPSTHIAFQGSTHQSTCTLVATNDYTGNVNLSCNTNGVACTISPSPVSLPQGGSVDSTLRITVDENEEAGEYTVDVVATEADHTKTSRVSIYVYPQGQNGPQDAVYSSNHEAPRCSVCGASCDSGSLLDGRDGKGPEPNQPNTLDSCTDGTSGTYHDDESIDKIVVRALDYNDMAPGTSVEIEATVWAWSDGSDDTADFYFTADASNPSWTLIGSVVAPGGGIQILTQQYALPSGSTQAVRVNFRYRGSADSCSGGSYDDHDDLVFEVCEALQCQVDEDCDDGLFCNGAETCNDGYCQAGTPPSCDDGLFCNGVETCNEATDTCDPGTPPACDDGLFCNGVETCNEATDTCDSGTPPACDDGLFCNGIETCNEATDTCDPGTPPACNFGCDEDGDSCFECVVDDDCDDGDFCNGAETCNAGYCQAGTPPTCNDSVGCTVDTCENGACVFTPNDAACDDGKFCTGTESCDAVSDCQPGTPPACDDGIACTDDRCDALTDQCLNEPKDSNCQQSAQPYCLTGVGCVECVNHGHCALGESCNDNACVANTHTPCQDRQNQALCLATPNVCPTDDSKPECKWKRNSCHQHHKCR